MLRSAFYWCVIWVVSAFFRIFYRLRIHRNAPFPQGAAIVAANHVSYLDPPLVAISCPEQIHFFANAKLFRNRVFGFLIQSLNAHPVKIETQDASALRQCLSILRQGHKLLIFPEGERSASGQLQPLKSGVAILSQKLDIPILPVTIQGADAAWPKSQSKPVLGKHLEVTFHDPIYPSQMESVSKKAQQALILERLAKVFSSSRPLSK